MSEKQREQSIKKIRTLWQMAKDAVDDDHYSADRWDAHYEKVLSILDKKIPKN
ncbi:hypothetical protein [Serratia marcescens]|uniref:hypothetical protein n=1 Tax=Serratia marcescens TaxID=615 RepID=UPI00158B314D|nr:hypothetical protein [Serratia marcescens]